MEYNASYKGAVLSSLKSASSGLKSCKSVNIDIPGDFEGAGVLKSALNTLKSINVDGIISQVSGAASAFEAAENAVESATAGFLDLFGSLLGDKSTKNKKKTEKKGATKSTKKDSHDVYHQIKSEKTTKQISGRQELEMEMSVRREYRKQGIIEKARS